MASYYWIKLYHEILDDPKMGLMDATLFAFTIKLFLIAGETDKEGELPPVEHIAWRLHLSVDDCNVSLHELKRNGIVDCNDNETVWIVASFAERQSPDKVKERVRQHRKRQAEQAKNTVTKNVTKRYIDKDIDKDINTTTPAQGLSTYFSTKTKKYPKGPIESQEWDDDCQEIIDKAEGDVTRAEGYVDESIAILVGLGYPRNKPAGLLNTIDNMLKPKPKRQNGASDGRKTISNQSTSASIELGQQLEKAFEGV